MSKRIKKVYNTKLLYRWSLPLWFTLLFILVVGAPLVVSLFIAPYSFGVGEKVGVTTLDMVMNLFKINEEGMAPVTSLIGDIKNADANNALVATVLNVLFVYVLPIVAMASAVFIVILVIFFLLGLCSGRFHHWKGPFIMSIFASVFGLLYFGGIIGLSLYLNSQNFNGNQFEYLYSIIYAAAMVGGCIFLGIIYYAGFKGKEFIPNKNYLQNYIQSVNHGMSNATSYSPQPIIINNNTTLPNNNPVAVIPSSPSPVVSKEEKPKTKTIVKIQKVHETEVDQNLTYISGHAYAKNIYLLSATIPDGVKSIGPSAFANCVNIKVATIPTSVEEIGYNAFFNCHNLEKIVYSGTKAQWRQIKRGSNWLAKAGTTIVSCIDGAIKVNPYRK